VRRLALLVTAVSAAGAGVAAPAAGARTTNVGVGLREFRLAPFRDVVKPGNVRFYVSNHGEDAHNLVVMRRGRVYGKTPEIRSREERTLLVRLRRRGHYRLVCTLFDHEARGMVARLIVR
jgi:plastocyanin